MCNRRSKVLLSAIFVSLISMLSPIGAVQALDYNQEAGINVSSHDINSIEANDRSQTISAEFAYNFAPVFISGPVTQHAYVQKISRFEFKANYPFSDNHVGNNSRNNQVTLTLFPPGRPYYMDASFAKSAVTLADGQMDMVNHDVLSFGLFSSRLRSYGVTIRNTRAQSVFTRSGMFPLGKSRGAFVKDISRIGLDVSVMYRLDLNFGHFEASNGNAQQYQDAGLNLALYPDRRQEWALGYRRYRIEDSRDTTDSRLLSYTNYFNKYNGLALTVKADRSSAQDQHSVSIGWKFRL